MMNASLKEGVVSPTSALAMAGSASVFAMASTTGSPAFVGTLAGFGANDYTRDPQGFFSAQLGLTGALAFSACGLRLYFANGTRIRYLDFNDGQVKYATNADAAVTALCTNPDGGLFFATQTRLFQYLQDNGECKLIVGGGVAGNNAAGGAAGFSNIKDITADGHMNVLVLDAHQVRKVTFRDDTADVTTLCGTNAAGHNDGIGESGRFNDPQGIAYDTSNGNIYIADAGTNAPYYF